MHALLTASEGKGKAADDQLASLSSLLDPATLAKLKIVIGTLAEACDAKNWANASGIPDLQRFKAVEAVNIENAMLASQPRQ